MRMKRKLYEQLFDRLELAESQEFNLEASWYAYAIIEDRLNSLLRSSGGVEAGGGRRRRLRMLGEKLKELSDRAERDPVLRSCLSQEEIEAWKDERNQMMHAMADGSLTIGEIDARASSLATHGREVAKKVSADAMRLKKIRKKERQ